MGGGAVSDGAEDRLRGGVRGDRGAALCTVFRADAGADGLLLAISMEPCSPKLRICVCNPRVLLAARRKRKSNETLSNVWAHRLCIHFYSHLRYKSAKVVAGVECE